jgi:hypothetical protein
MWSGMPPVSRDKEDKIFNFDLAWGHLIAARIYQNKATKKRKKLLARLNLSRFFN